MPISRLPGYEHEREYQLMSFWLAALLYGAYFTLFVNALHGMVRRWRHTSKVFIVGICLMFMLTTLHTIFKGYTLVLAFGKQEDRKSTIQVLHSYWRWNTFGSSVMVNLIVWVADFLAIYRCYVIWGRRWYVVIFPVVILLSTMSKSIYSLHWFLHPERDDLKATALIFLRLCYPFNLAQNVITTGLIAFKVWKQHRESYAAGLRGASGSGVSLMTVFYLIIESASIYTALMFCLTVMYQTGHRSVAILQASIAPCASMVFVMMCVRMDAIRKRLDAERSFAFPTMLETGYGNPTSTATSASQSRMTQVSSLSPETKEGAEGEKAV